MNIKELILAFFTGFATGAVFSFFRLPVPAPAALAGVLGVVGIFIGYVVVNLVRK